MSELQTVAWELRSVPSRSLVAITGDASVARVWKESGKEVEPLCKVADAQAAVEAESKKWELAHACNTDTLNALHAEVEERDQRIAALEAALKGARGRVRAERVKGETMEEWRANISRDFYNLGDAVLCWVNEGDLCMAAMDMQAATINEVLP